MLTPLDLNGKTFSKSFRGYDTDEVNQFFLQISKEYERLYQDNVELKDWSIISGWKAPCRARW